MGRLSPVTVANVRVLNPCEAIDNIVSENNIEDTRVGTVLSCTINLTNLTVQQMAWLIVYKEPTHAVEIAKDIYEASNTTKLTLAQMDALTEPVLIADSVQVRNDKYFYYTFRNINSYNVNRTEEQNKALRMLIARMVEYVSTNENKNGIHIIRDGLTIFDNKVV
jgi:hypothetical protein